MTQEQEVAAPEATPAEANAAFESGFGEVRPEPTPKPEPKAEEKKEVVEAPKEKVEAPAAVTPTEQKPDPVMAKLEAITQSLGQFERRLRNNEGQFGTLNSTMRQLVDAGKAAVLAAPAAQKEAVASKVDEQLKQIGTDLPDVAEAVRAARDELRAEIPKIDVEAFKADSKKALDERVAAIEAANEERVTKAVAQARTLATIDLKHDGWEETVDSPEFEGWYGRQNAEVQALSRSPKATDAIRLLDLYKGDQEKARQKQEQDKSNADRLARATTPKGVAAPVTASVTDNDAFEEGFAAARGR